MILRKRVSRRVRDTQEKQTTPILFTAGLYISPLNFISSDGFANLKYRNIAIVIYYQICKFFICEYYFCFHSRSRFQDVTGKCQRMSNVKSQDFVVVTWEDRSVCLLLKTICYYRFVHRLFGFYVILDQGTNFFIFHTRGPAWQICPPFMQVFYLLHFRGPSWHSDHLSLSVHPLLNTIFFKLIFFFLTTALIFLVTVAVAIIIIKLTEIIGWLVEVREIYSLSETIYIHHISNLYTYQKIFKNLKTKTEL